MGYYCTVPQCTSLAGKTKNVKFHKFPSDERQADKWNVLLKRGKPYTKYSKVCSLHFTQSDYNVTAMGKGQWKTLSKDAVPSQNLPRLHPDGSVMVIRKSRTVKYRDSPVKKEVDRSSLHSEGSEEKWRHNVPPTPTVSQTVSATTVSHTSSQATVVSSSTSTQDGQVHTSPLHDTVSYRGGQSSCDSVEPHQLSGRKCHKQDAFMQTDPVSPGGDHDDHLNTTLSSHESAESSFQSEQNVEQFNLPLPLPLPDQYSTHAHSPEADSYTHTHAHSVQSSGGDNYEIPKDYTKTNDEYQSVAGSKYSMDRKSYDKQPLSPSGYNKYTYTSAHEYTHTHAHNKLQQYQPRLNTDIYNYAHNPSYADAVEMLRAQQHNLQLLQQGGHQGGQLLQQGGQGGQLQREGGETYIKQENDLSQDDDRYNYDAAKDMESPVGVVGAAYSREDERRLQQQRVLEQLQLQVKSEPDPLTGCESVLQTQESPYYQTNGLLAGGYYEQFSRGQPTGCTPGGAAGGTVAAVAAVSTVNTAHSSERPQPGAELLIAKQNALAAHTQLWPNSMKRPFTYSDISHYTSSQLIQRYEV